MTGFKVTLPHEQIGKRGVITLSREIQSMSQPLWDTKRFVVFIGNMTENVEMGIPRKR